MLSASAFGLAVNTYSTLIIPDIKKPFPIIAYYYYNELINKANNRLTKGVN